MMSRERHRQLSPGSSRRRRKERRDSREQLQQITVSNPPFEERAEPVNQRSRALSSLSSSSSTSSSLLNISRPSGRFGLGSFFSRKQHRVRKRRRGIFRSGNSSTSSVNSDLAYGRGYIERRRSREFSPPNGSGRPALSRNAQTDEEIIELGRKFAEIARQQNAEDLRAAGKTRPSTLVGAAAALSQFRRTNSGHSNRGAGGSKIRRDSSPDDSDWESASDDDSSSDGFDSGLAYGSGLSLPSTSTKPIRPQSAPRSLLPPAHSPSLHRKPSVVDPNLFGPVNSLRGYVETPCGFEKVDRSTMSEPRRPYEPSTPPRETQSERRPLQRVYPVPTSDPARFDAARSSVVSSVQQDLPTLSRPGPVPIQQPRPIAPVSTKVLESVETDSRYSERALSRRALEDVAVAGVAGAAITSALSSERKDDRDRHEGKRDRDGKRRSKRSGVGVQDEKNEKRKVRDEPREVREDRHERRRERRLEQDRESERERRHHETILREAERELEKEKRRRDETREDGYDYDQAREIREDDRKGERSIDRRELRGEERREEVPSSHPDLESYKRLEGLRYQPREVPVDPFQFQVTDDAFHTPLYTTPKRPLTPNVVTVDREPDFSRFELEDKAHPPERLSRRDSYERELREAKEVYEATEHATAPVSGAAFAAATAAVLAEDRRGRSRSRGSDASSKNRSGRSESLKRDKDVVLEDANRYYREAELARKIKEEETRSRKSTESSVVDKWKQDREPAVVEVIPPPEMDHPKKKSPYDGPDADVRIDNVLEHPRELTRFRVAGSKGLFETPVFKARDPSAERERPMLNLVRPTPVPTPVPEEQRLADQSSSELVKEVDTSTSKAPRKVVTESRGEVVPALPTPKAVSWGENQTKHYVVESPEREDDPYSGAKIVTPAKTPRSRPGKKSAWGILAAAVSGASDGATSSSVSDSTVDPEATRTRRVTKDDEKPASRKSSAQFESTYENPPIPGPKPPSPRSAQMPGAFAEDPAFTANIAAALEGSGFDPNIVIDDASFHRRDSPPGSNDSGVYRSPFVESTTDLGIIDTSGPGVPPNGREHGFVIGEVPETPADEKDIPTHHSEILSMLHDKERRKQEKATDRGDAKRPEVTIDDSRAVEISRPIAEDDWDVSSSKLSKKERKRRERAARTPTLDDDIPVDEAPRNEQDLEAEFMGAAADDGDDSLKKKKSKKSKKAIVVQDDSKQPDITESSKVVVPIDAFQDLQDAQAIESSKITVPVNAFRDVQDAKTAQLEDTWDLPKESRRRSKRVSDVYDSPSRLPPTPEPSGESYRNAVEAHLFTTPDDEWDLPKEKSRRSRRDSESYGSPPRSVPASELSRESSYRVIDADSIPATEEEWDTPKKSKKKSKRYSGAYDSPSRSAPASEASLEFVRKISDFDTTSLPDEEQDTPKRSRKIKRGSVGDEFASSTVLSIDESDVPKKSKKSSKRDSGAYDSPSRVEPSADDIVESPKQMRESFSDLRSEKTTATEEEWDTPKKSKKKSKRSSTTYEDSPSTPKSQSAAPSEGSVASSKKSRQDSYPDSPSRSIPASEIGIDDYRKKTKKKKRRSAPGDFPEEGNPDESELLDRGKDRFDVVDRDVSSIVSDPSRYDDHRSSRSRARDDTLDDTKSVASAPSGADRRDRKSSKPEKDKRSSGGSSFFERFRSSIGIVEERPRKSEDDKKNSFLDNADTLGAGVGSGADVAPASQESRSNATNAPLEEEAQTPITPLRQSTPSQEVEFIDPEIVPREIRPAIDPKYGDLLPLPPSLPGSPVSELGDNIPPLPDSRPETPEHERLLREMPTHLRRRSAHETPTRPKTPSQSAIPIQFRLGHRRTPSNVRSSPSMSPIVGNSDFGSEPRTRSRPTSWEGSRDFKPLLLLLRQSRGSVDTSSSPERESSSSEKYHDVSPSRTEAREGDSRSSSRMPPISTNHGPQWRENSFAIGAQATSREPMNASGAIDSPKTISQPLDDGIPTQPSDGPMQEQDVEEDEFHLAPEQPTLESAEDTHLLSSKTQHVGLEPTALSSDLHSPPSAAQEPSDAGIPQSSTTLAPAQRIIDLSDTTEIAPQDDPEVANTLVKTTPAAIEEVAVGVALGRGLNPATEVVDPPSTQSKDVPILDVLLESEIPESTHTLVTPESSAKDYTPVELSSSLEKSIYDDKVHEGISSETNDTLEASTQPDAALIQELTLPSSDVPEQVSPADQAEEPTQVEEPTRLEELTRFEEPTPAEISKVDVPQALERDADTTKPMGEPLSEFPVPEVGEQLLSEEAPKETTVTPEVKAEASNVQQTPTTTSKKSKKKKKNRKSQVTERSLGDQPVAAETEGINLDEVPTLQLEENAPGHDIPSSVEEAPSAAAEQSVAVEEPTVTEQELITVDELATVEEPAAVEQELATEMQHPTVKSEIPAIEPEPATVGSEPTVIEQDSSTVETENAAQAETSTTQSDIPSVESERAVPESETPALQPEPLNLELSTPEPSTFEPETSTPEPQLTPIEQVPPVIEPERAIVDTKPDETPAAEPEITAANKEDPVAEGEPIIIESDISAAKLEPIAELEPAAPEQEPGVTEKELSRAEVEPVAELELAAVEQESTSAKEELAIAEEEKLEQPTSVPQSSASVSKKDKKRRKGKQRSSPEREQTEPVAPAEESAPVAGESTQEGILEISDVPPVESQSSSQGQPDAVISQGTRDAQPSLSEGAPSTAKKSKKKKKGKKTQTPVSELESETTGEQISTQEDKSQLPSEDVPFVPAVQETEAMLPADSQGLGSFPGDLAEAPISSKEAELELEPPAEDKSIGEETLSEEPLRFSSEIGRDDEKYGESTSLSGPSEPTLTELKSDGLSDLQSALPSDLEHEEQPHSTTRPISGQTQLRGDILKPEELAEVSTVHEDLNIEQQHEGQHTLAETSLQGPDEQEQSGSEPLEQTNVDESLLQPKVLGGEEIREEQVPALTAPPETPLPGTKSTENFPDKSAEQLEAVEEQTASNVVADDVQPLTSTEPIAEEPQEMSRDAPVSKKKGKKGKKKRQDTLEIVDTPVETETIEESVPQQTPLESDANEPSVVDDALEKPAQELTEPADEDLSNEPTTTGKKSKKGKKKRQNSNSAGPDDELEASKLEEPPSEPQADPEIVQEPALEQAEPTGDDVWPEADNTGKKSKKKKGKKARQTADAPVLEDEPESSKSAEEPANIHTGAASSQSMDDIHVSASEIDVAAGNQLEHDQAPEAESTFGMTEKGKQRDSTQIERATSEISQETSENLVLQDNTNNEATSQIDPTTNVDNIDTTNQTEETAPSTVTPEISTEPSAISEELAPAKKDDSESGFTSTSTKRSKKDKKKKKRQSVQFSEPLEQDPTETPTEPVGELPASDMAFDTDWASVEIPPPPDFSLESEGYPDDGPSNIGDSWKTEYEPSQNQPIDPLDKLIQQLGARKQAEALIDQGNKLESQDVNVSTIPEVSEGPSAQKITEDLVEAPVDESTDQTLVETASKDELDNIQQSLEEVPVNEQQSTIDQEPVETAIVQEPTIHDESPVPSIPTNQNTLATEVDTADVSQARDVIEQHEEIQTGNNIATKPQVDESALVAPRSFEDDQPRDLTTDSQAEPTPSAQEATSVTAEEFPTVTKKNKKGKKKRKSTGQDTLGSTSGTVTPAEDSIAEAAPSEHVELCSTISQDQTEQGQIASDAPMTAEPEELASQPQEEEAQSSVSKKSKKDKKKKRASQIQEPGPSTLPVEEPAIERPRSPVHDSSLLQNIASSDLPPAEEVEMPQPPTEQELSDQPILPTPELDKATAYTADVPIPAEQESESQIPDLTNTAVHPQDAELERATEVEKAGDDVLVVETRPEIDSSGDTIDSLGQEETRQTVELTENAMLENEPVAESPILDKDGLEAVTTRKSKKNKKKKKQRDSQTASDDTASAPSHEASESASGIQTPINEATSSAEDPITIPTEDVAHSVAEKAIEPTESATVVERDISESILNNQPSIDVKDFVEKPAESFPGQSTLSTQIDEVVPQASDETSKDKEVEAESLQDEEAPPQITDQAVEGLHAPTIDEPPELDASAPTEILKDESQEASLETTDVTEQPETGTSTPQQSSKDEETTDLAVTKKSKKGKKKKADVQPQDEQRQVETEPTVEPDVSEPVEAEIPVPEGSKAENLNEFVPTEKGKDEEKKRTSILEDETALQEEPAQISGDLAPITSTTEQIVTEEPLIPETPKDESTIDTTPGKKSKKSKKKKRASTREPEPELEPAEPEPEPKLPTKPEADIAPQPVTSSVETSSSDTLPMSTEDMTLAEEGLSTGPSEMPHKSASSDETPTLITQDSISLAEEGLSTVQPVEIAEEQIIREPSSESNARVPKPIPMEGIETAPISSDSTESASQELEQQAKDILPSPPPQEHESVPVTQEPQQSDEKFGDSLHDTIAEEQQGEPIQLEETIRPEETSLPTESTQPEELLKSEEPLQVQETSKPEEPAQVDEPSTSEALVDLEDLAKVEELAQLEEPVQLKEPVEAEELVKAEESVQPEEPTRMEEPEQFEEPVQPESTPQEPSKAEESGQTEEVIQPKESTLQELPQSEQLAQVEEPAQPEESTQLIDEAPATLDEPQVVPAKKSKKAKKKKRASQAEPEPISENTQLVEESQAQAVLPERPSEQEIPKELTEASETILKPDDQTTPFKDNESTEDAPTEMATGKKSKKKKKPASQLQPEPESKAESTPSSEPTEQLSLPEHPEPQVLDVRPTVEDTSATAIDTANPEDVFPEVSTNKKSKKKKKRASQVDWEPESDMVAPSESQEQPVLLEKSLVQEPVEQPDSQPNIEEPVTVEDEEKPEEVFPELTSSKKSKKKRQAKKLAASATEPGPEPEPERDLKIDEPVATEATSSHPEQLSEPVNPISEPETLPVTDATLGDLKVEDLQPQPIEAESSTRLDQDHTLDIAKEEEGGMSESIDQERTRLNQEPSFIISPSVEDMEKDTSLDRTADAIIETTETADEPSEFRAKDLEKEDKEIHAPGIPELGPKEVPNVEVQFQVLPDTQKPDETVESDAPIVTEEKLQVEHSDVPESQKTPEMSNIEPREQLPADQQIDLDASLSKEPEAEPSPVPRKKSKKDKKKKRSSVQADSESASGTQTPSTQEPVLGGLIETITTEPVTQEVGKTITDEGEWPESPTKKSKKDKKRRKASGTSTPLESMEDVPAIAPPETVTEENIPENPALEEISEVEGQSSKAQDVQKDENLSKLKDQDQNAKDINISHPTKETVVVLEDSQQAVPAEEGQRAQPDEEPTRTAQDISDRIESLAPTFRPQTPSTTVPPVISVDLSPAQLSSHVEHDRPFDQSPQPGKKARTQLSTDDAMIPEPLSAQVNIPFQDLSHEVPESLLLTRHSITETENDNAIPEDITPAREIAASYLESQPIPMDDVLPTVEEKGEVEQIRTPGLLPVITPQREIAASYFEGHAPTATKTKNEPDDNGRELTDATPIMPFENISASQPEPQSDQLELAHAEKTLPVQTDETRQPSPVQDTAPSAREIAATLMESRPKSSVTRNEAPKDVESIVTEAVSAPTREVPPSAEKSGPAKKGKKGKKKQKYVDKRTPDTDDILDDPALWESSEPKALEEGGRLDTDVGDFWTGPSTEVEDHAEAPLPDVMDVVPLIDQPARQPAKESVTENLDIESPVVGREVQHDLPEPRDAAHDGPISREPPTSEIIEKLDDLDTSEHPSESRELIKEQRVDNESLKALSPRPLVQDYMSSGRASPRILPPVEEETHEDLEKELHDQSHDATKKSRVSTEPNRDSGFVTGSPRPMRRSLADDPGQRDSGVHLRDWQEEKEEGLQEEERSTIRTPQPKERRSKKLGVGSETPKLNTPISHSQDDEQQSTTDPKKTSSSKYQDVGQRSVSDNISRGSTPRSESQPRRSASNTSISRLRTRTRTPEPLRFRPESPGSNLSRSGTNTPPLRRVDKRMSGDLRSLSSNLSNNNASKENLHLQSTTPVANEGRVRAKDMTDVYDGYGEGRIGSPRSPTRPQSMRRRQSMQVLELESRVEQLIAENRALADAKIQAEQNLNHQAVSAITERDAEIESLRASLEWLRKEVTRLTEVNEGLHSANNVLALQHNEKYGRLESQHASTARELNDHRSARDQFTRTLQEKDAEIQELRAQLEATKEQIREMQRQILAAKPPDAEFLRIKDEDHFDHRCQQLCSHVQQWVLRFSKFSDMRACRLTSEINDDKVIDRLDNSVLDGSDVDDYLSDRVKRRDIFMSTTMNMIWEFVFTRYLFGMDREQRQKLKSLEKLLLEVGPPQAVRQWRAVTLTLLSKRPAFGDQRNQDTEAVVQAIFQTLCMTLPPPSNLEAQIQSQLRRVMREAVDLSIEMRTQRAEYMMLPPLQPEYDANGDLARTVAFNAALMNERSGDSVTNEEYEARGAIVRTVLFPLVVKKGDDNGVGDNEIVVCPAQVLVAKAPRHSTIRMVTPSSEAGGVPLSRGATPSVSLPAQSTVSLQMQDAPLPIPTPPHESDYI